MFTTRNKTRLRNSLKYLSFFLASILLVVGYFKLFNRPDPEPVIDVAPQEKAAQQHQEKATKHVQASRNYTHQAKIIDEQINQRDKEVINEVFDIPTLHNKRDSIRAAEGFDLLNSK